MHPAYDEELKQAKEILKQKGRLADALAIEKELGQLDEMQARVGLMTAKNSPDAQSSKITKDELGELRRRMIISGGHLNPRDARQMELAQKLGIDTSGGSGRRGINPANIKPVGSDLVYVDNVDGQPVAIKIYSASGMTDAEKRRQAIDIARLNEQRSRDSLPPLDFPEDSYSVQPSDASTTSTTAAPSTTATPQVTTQPSVLTPQTTPQTTQTLRPRLQPIPGAKPEPVVRPVYRGRGRSSSRAASGGQARTDQIGASLDARDAARYQQEAAHERKRRLHAHAARMMSLRVGRRRRARLMRTRERLGSVGALRRGILPRRRRVIR